MMPLYFAHCQLLPSMYMGPSKDCGDCVVYIYTYRCIYNIDENI